MNNIHTKHLSKLNKSEHGYASFVITLVTIIVTSLIVIGFSADARIEQKNSLADAEAAQAYYTAESGANDAYAQIQAGQIPNSATTGCTPSEYENTLAKTNTLSAYNLYSCLVVNPTPNILAYTLTPGKGVVVPAIDTSGNINSITLSWQTSNITQTFTGCPASSTTNLNLPKFAAYADCSAGLIQVDITDNTEIENSNVSTSPINYSPPSQNTIYLAPETNLLDSPPGIIGSASPTSQVQVQYVQCSPSLITGEQYSCSETLNLSSFNDSAFYLHLQSFYQTQSLAITAQSSIGGAVSFTNSQILIDSTGKANGQIKRIREWVCDNSFCNNNAPAAAIESTQCIDKQYEVYPGMTGPSCTSTDSSP